MREHQTSRTKYFKKKAVTAQERRDIAARYGCINGGSVEARCIYCGKIGEICWLKQDRGKGWVIFINLEIEHVHPEFQGGGGGDNLDVACMPCNRGKGARTIAEWIGASKVSVLTPCRKWCIVT